MPSPKTPKKKTARPPLHRAPRVTKEVSAMGWIENPYGQVLLVRQVRGRKLWALPGGKIEGTETVETGLRREILEETGLAVTFASHIALFDRPERANLTFLYRVTVAPGLTTTRPGEISEVKFTATLPTNATPSLRHFWHLLRGQHPL